MALLSEAPVVCICSAWWQPRDPPLIGINKQILTTCYSGLQRGDDSMPATNKRKQPVGGFTLEAFVRKKPVSTEEDVNSPRTDEVEPSTSTTDANSAEETTVTSPCTQQNHQQESPSTRENANGKKKRKFLANWKHNRPWLVFNTSRQMMFCTVCQQAKVANSFTVGCTVLKKENVVLHEKRSGLNSHKSALAIMKDSSGLKELTVKAMKKSEEAATAALRNVYFLAKSNCPSSLMPSLNELSSLQGVAAVDDLKVDKHTSYEHHQSVRDFQKAIASVLQKEIETELNQATFFSITIDESTDIAVEQNLVITVRYLLLNEGVRIVQSRLDFLV